MPLTQAEIDAFLDAAIQCNLIQSTRRLIFTLCTEKREQRSRYYADILYNLGGTSTLIKYEEIFFLLTAQHVIDKHYTAPQNESPFFTNALANSAWDEISKLLYPLRGWKIGSLIKCDNPWVDEDDIVLVELGQPMPGGYPENFLDLDSSDSVSIVTAEDFYEGMVLLAAGYPIDENLIEQSDDGIHDHKTNLKRTTFPGFCVIENGHPYIEFQKKHSHQVMNGISGGMVTNLQPAPDEVAWAGMIQKAGNGSLRFYPAHLILPAILNYRASQNYVIDPAVHLTNPEYHATPEALEGRREFNAMVKELTQRRKIN